MNPRPNTTLACALRGFFTDYLPRQRALSPHTLQSYRDSLKLLLQFAGDRGDPSLLSVEHFERGTDYHFPERSGNSPTQPSRHTQRALERHP